VTPDFDVIVVGSGPAGVSAAFPLVEAGLRVLMVDGGKRPDINPPETDFLSARANDDKQWEWMVGKDFHALKMLDAVSPKLRVPFHAYAFDGFGHENRIEGKSFITVGSLAKGGLSNAWGCGVARFSPGEISELPFPASDLDLSYAKVSRRMGISGKADDDLSDYFMLDEYAQPPIPMDISHAYMFRLYSDQRKILHSRGFKLGHSRVAVLSEDIFGRQACNLSGNCLWGCQRHSLYSATYDLLALRRYKNFSELSGFVVEELKCSKGGWRIEGCGTSDSGLKSISAGKIVMAAGTLATTRIVLKSLNYTQPVPVLSCPTAAFLLWLPKMTGAPRMPGFGLGQLSFTLSLHGDYTAHGSTFSTTGIQLSEFARHVPMRRRCSMDLLRGLLSSCVVGNLFLPGRLTAAEAKLDNNESLIISGKYGGEAQPLMHEANRALSRAYRRLGAVLLPGSFTVASPGADIHYAGTLPMKVSPSRGETSPYGEVNGLDGVFVVDGACLPMLPEKPHTLTIMANADRIGRQLAACKSHYSN